MRQYLYQFMNTHHWPQEASDSILEYYDIFTSRENCRNVLFKWTELYKDQIEIDFLRANREIASEAKAAGLGVYEAQLLLYLCFSRYLPSHYMHAGLPAEVCVSSLDDLKWKALECHKIYGVWGSFVADWFPRFFMLTRFTLGRLQFEEISFPEDYPAQGVMWPQNAGLVLNTHIPSAGPLEHESCLRSYRLAADFWEKYFRRTSPVICCFSWLLYPAHEKFLPENSNILKFQRDFEVYKAWQDEEYKDLWRIFGCMYDGRVQYLPEDTSLRRAYKKWIEGGNLPGGGKGILKKEILV